MKLAPQTRSSEVVDSLNEILSRGFYMEETAWDMRLMKREIEKVRSADPAIGWALMGSYSVLLGDLAETERCFSASLALAKNPITFGNFHASLGNLGYFSRAHAFFVEMGRPELCMLSALAHYAENMGSFQTAVRYIKEAESMGMDLHHRISAECVRAAEVLAKVGISDDHVVRHMDAVGEVLRRHGQFYGDDIKVKVADVDGELVAVTCVFEVHGSAHEVFNLNVELAMVEEELATEKHSAFDVMFLPV